MQEQLNSDINFLLKTLNWAQMVSIYTRQSPNAQTIAKVNNLRRQFFFEMRDKKLAGEEIPKEWQQELKRRLMELKNERGK